MPTATCRPHPLPPPVALACRSDPDKDVTPCPPPDPDEATIRTSFARFRIASIVEGIALLVLVGIMVMRYGVYGDGWFESVSRHGTDSGVSPIHA